MLIGASIQSEVLRVKRVISVALLILSCLSATIISTKTASAADQDALLKKWERSANAKDDIGGDFTLKAIPYTAEYVNAYIESEAEKNLWTASEMDDYKYNFLRSIQMDDYFAFFLEIENLGPTAHMAPFNEMVYVWINNKKYTPVNYDERFNLPLQGKREGLVFFPRFDEKTGKSLFDKDMTLRLVLVGAASPVLSNRDIRMTWDIKAENNVIIGNAADRLEIDRLLRRVEKLSSEKNSLEAQLAEKSAEISEIMKRINKLQGKE